MARFLIPTTFFIVFIVILVPLNSEAQSRSYEVLPAPDIWYNDVDGIRLGIRLKGQLPGTFEDGPHRLDFGFWVGTWLPSLPVSYYLSYTEPISAWSEYGSEASIQLISSVRTGYNIQGIAFNKRWQQSFDERRYREIRLFNSYEKRFDDEYTAFPVLWSDDDKLLTRLSAELQDDNALGWYNLNLTGSIQYLNETYTTASATAIQRINFNDNWGLRLRGFAGAASPNTAPEYLFSRSSGSAIETIQPGITRAKGTIPQPWMESGKFHLAGGANLRGYTFQDIDSYTQYPCVNCDDNSAELNVVNPLLFRSMLAFNSEFDYPNPLKILFNRIPFVSEFVDFRSYLFFDAGRSLGTGTDSTTLFADAGAGFSLSLNIPDYHGKPRGFVLRYEIPAWLSEPGSEDSLKLRHLFGFGAVISF